MSTKLPIVRGAKFELYTDWHEQENVMLKLEGVQCDSERGSVTVHIPIALWEFLRTIPAASTEAASLNDAQLLAKAEEYVDKRIADWEARENERRKLPPKRRGFLSSILNRPDRPREEQLREAVRTFIGERHSARELLRAIAAYRREVSPEERRKRDEAHSRYWKRQHQKWQRYKAAQERREKAEQAKQAKRVDDIMSRVGSRSAKANGSLRTA